jgi:SAM-dependent methyltransferase
VDDEVRFAADLYRGTAGYYDRYRLPYPEAMITDLVRRARVSGRGRLLDLACGTGQLAFPLRRWFCEVQAVDSEPDMAEVIRAKAAAARADGVLPVVSSAETLHAEPGYFELAVIGNAFHRLDRDLVAGRILGWLEPGGHLALCWSSSPWAGERDWQRAHTGRPLPSRPVPCRFSRGQPSVSAAAMDSRAVLISSSAPSPKSPLM